MVSWFSMLATGLYSDFLVHSFQACSDSFCQQFFFFETVGQRELQCAFADQHHVRGFLHDQTRHGNGMDDVFEECHRATAAVLVHDAGVEGDAAVAVGQPPKPTEVSFGSPSGTRAPASTASRARPLAASIFQAASLAVRPKFQVESTMGLVVSGVSARLCATGNMPAPKADSFKKSLRVFFMV